MPRTALRPLAAACGAVVAGVLPMFLTAGLALRIGADLPFGEVSLGVAVAAFHAVSALTSPRFGRLVERIGPVPALRLSGAMAIAATAGIAAAGRSAGAMIALLAIAGLANGASGPGASALLARTVPVGRRGLAFGAQQAGAPLASLLAGIGLSVVAAALGWRCAFGLAALVGVAAVAAVPRSVPAARVAAPPAKPGSIRELRVLAVAAALASATSTGMMAFLVVFAVRSGIAEATAGALLVLVSATAMASRIGLGLSVDRRGGDALAIGARLLCASAAGCLALATAEPVLIVLGALAVGGLGWAWTGLFTLAAVKRHPGAPGRAVGIMMSGLFAGATAGPLLVGAFAQRDAYTHAWIACATLALLAAAGVAPARDGRRRGRRGEGSGHAPMPSVATPAGLAVNGPSTTKPLAGLTLNGPSTRNGAGAAPAGAAAPRSPVRTASVASEERRLMRSMAIFPSRVLGWCRKG